MDQSTWLMQTINPGTHWLSWSAGIAQLHKAAARIELWTRNNLTVCAALANDHMELMLSTCVGRAGSSSGCG